MNKLSVDKLCVEEAGREEEEAEEAEVRGSAKPKTRTPHTDAGKNILKKLFECCYFQHLSLRTSRGFQWIIIGWNDGQ